MNDDLISRSALLEKLSKINPIEQKHPLYFLWRLSLSVALREIKAAPAVDAVEVVRCRDCVHDGLPTCFTCYIEQHEMIFLNHDPEFFCGAGERKAYGERRAE